MNSCCPIALLLRNRGLLLALVVLVPFGFLVASAVREGLSERAALGPASACPAAAAGGGAADRAGERSCESMHVRLERSAACPAAPGVPDLALPAPAAVPSPPASGIH